MRRMVAVVIAGLVGVCACQQSGKLPLAVSSSNRQTDEASSTVAGLTATPQTTAHGRDARSDSGLPQFPGGARSGQVRPIRRGVLKVKVYDTPLDLQLDALTILSGSYKLEGFGVRFVGQMSQNWQGQWGKPVAIERRNATFGDSEMNLPMVGKVGVVGGTILLDKVVGQDTPRVHGHVAFTLPGPNGPASFTGDFEVDVIVQ